MTEIPKQQSSKTIFYNSLRKQNKFLPDIFYFTGEWARLVNAGKKSLLDKNQIRIPDFDEFKKLKVQLLLNRAFADSRTEPYLYRNSTSIFTLNKEYVVTLTTQIIHTLAPDLFEGLTPNERDSSETETSTKSKTNSKKSTNSKSSVTEDHRLMAIEEMKTIQELEKRDLSITRRSSASQRSMSSPGSKDSYTESNTNLAEEMKKLKMQFEKEKLKLKMENIRLFQENKDLKKRLVEYEKNNKAFPYM